MVEAQGVERGLAVARTIALVRTEVSACLEEERIRLPHAADLADRLVDLAVGEDSHLEVVALGVDRVGEALVQKYVRLLA
jgi:hypothetical protein